MSNYFKIVKFIPILLPFTLLFFTLFFVLIIVGATSNNPTIIASGEFQKPFADDVNYRISSHFGYRNDPFGSGEIKHHSGIDLATSMGTPVLAIGDGIVYKIVLSDTGLGNHIYLKHDLNGTIYYSVYGHLLDDSIVVSENELVLAGQQIASVGTTGSSTGYHLHLAILSPIPSFDKKYLLDPYDIINGL